MRLTYRATQFLHSIFARPSQTRLQEARAYLPANLRSLYSELSPSDQAHGLRVLNALLQQGESHPDLLAAALLHDIGKGGQRLLPWERVLVVLAGKLMPRAASRWAAGHPLGWRRPFVIAGQHAKWGAERVGRAGGSELLQSLILRHQDPLPAVALGQEGERLLTALQRADGSN